MIPKTAGVSAVVKSQKAVAKFIPQMEEIFGEHWLAEVPLSDGGTWAVPAADFIFPMLYPAVILEHKTSICKGRASNAKQQVDSYVMNANWIGKVTGEVMGILTDGDEWRIRNYKSGIPKDGWTVTTVCEISDSIRGRYFPINYELAFKLKPFQTDRNRVERNRGSGGVAGA